MSCLTCRGGGLITCGAGIIKCPDCKSAARPSGPGALFLPPIDNICRAWCEDTELMEFDKAGRPQWSQLAVDFVALLSDKCRKDKSPG